MFLICVSRGRFWPVFVAARQRTAHASSRWGRIPISLAAVRVLPGVGSKSAQRMAYHLLERQREGGRRLSALLAQAMEQIRHCARCRDFSETEICASCANTARDTQLLCVVETPADRLAMDLHLNDSVVFHGSLAPAKVHELLAASDVFLQHSLNYHTRWEEGFGVSITEASATGLPVVVTRCGGIPDQVTDGENGFLVEQNDCEAMAERMVRLARTPELRERLGRAGRKRVEQEFDCALLTRRLQDCLLAAAKQAKQAIPAQWNNNPAQSTQGTPAVNHVRS